MPSARAVIGAAAAGAVGEYFLDPQNGRRRRHVARDKALAWVRRPTRRAVAETERRASYYAGKAEGLVHWAKTGGEERDPSRLNDAALKAKIESVVFRPADFPKGSININVENRAVYLRGEVPDERMIERLVNEIEAIDGVGEVHSLLHEPGASASHKV
jgi:osmotically-inducible protein OsmY